MKRLISALTLSLCTMMVCHISAQMSVINLSKKTPVLTNKEFSPILHFNLKGVGDDDSILRKLTFSLDGTINADDIESASLFKNSRKPEYGEVLPDSLIETVRPLDGNICFVPNIRLESDSSDFWITLNLRETAFSPHARLRVTGEELLTNREGIRIDSLTSGVRRIGVAVRNHEADGINTSRIPGLVTTTKGTLIALYDARNERDDDLQGDIDIVVNRSTDGGKTWGPVIKVIDMGEYDGLHQRYNGVSDGSLLVDTNSGRIFATGLWMHGINDPVTGKWVENLNDTSTQWNHQWRSFGSQPGYDIHGTSQFLMVVSDDDGETWSEPVNITRRIKKEQDWLMAPAPGRGIVLKDGALVFPAQGRDSVGMAFSTIISSNDGGRTWAAGEPASYNTNECQVVELSDGEIMLNARHRANRNRKEGNGREVVVTRDLGKNWEKHPTSRNALIEPTCQASIFRFDYSREGVAKHILIFSNPSDISRRINHTLKVSFDDGMTWPEEYWILLDEGLGAGYSCLTAVDDETVGIFFEGSQADIQFMAIPLSEILKEI